MTRSDLRLIIDTSMVGQLKARVKSSMITVPKLMSIIKLLLKRQNGLCAITGLPLVLELTPRTWFSFPIIGLIDVKRGIGVDNLRLVMAVFRNTDRIKPSFNIHKELDCGMHEIPAVLINDLVKRLRRFSGIKIACKYCQYIQPNVDVSITIELAAGLCSACRTHWLTGIHYYCESISISWLQPHGFDHPFDYYGARWPHSFPIGEVGDTEFSICDNRDFAADIVEIIKRSLVNEINNFGKYYDRVLSRYSDCLDV